MAYGVHFNLVNKEKRIVSRTKRIGQGASAAHIKSSPLLSFSLLYNVKKKNRQIKAWKNKSSSSHTNTNITTTITTMEG